jgi:hypothetical protein
VKVEKQLSALGVGCYVEVSTTVDRVKELFEWFQDPKRCRMDDAAPPCTSPRRAAQLEICGG